MQEIKPKKAIQIENKNRLKENIVKMKKLGFTNFEIADLSKVLKYQYISQIMHHTEKYSISSDLSSVANKNLEAIIAQK